MEPALAFHAGIDSHSFSPGEKVRMRAGFFLSSIFGLKGCGHLNPLQDARSETFQANAPASWTAAALCRSGTTLGLPTGVGARSRSGDAHVPLGTGHLNPLPPGEGFHVAHASPPDRRSLNPTALFAKHAATAPSTSRKAGIGPLPSPAEFFNRLLGVFGPGIHSCKFVQFVSVFCVRSFCTGSGGARC
jgi:hypothetical protein